MKYVCEPRKCISCDNQIHIPGETFEQKVARGMYQEISLKLSNGSQMRVGICKDCKPQAQNLDHTAMLEAIKERWRATIRPARKEALEAQLKDLKVESLV